MGESQTRRLKLRKEKLSKKNSVPKKTIDETKMARANSDGPEALL